MASAPVALLSHIHAPQDWRHGNFEAIYTGSPYRTAYGETEAKSVVLLDATTAGYSWTRIATPARQMLLFTNAWTAGAFTSETPPPASCAHAEVRFRYRVDPDQAGGAKRAAEVWKAQALEAGAVDVKLDAEKNSVSTARIPEIITARSDSEKLAALRRARGIMLDETRLARLEARIAMIEAEHAAVVRRTGCRSGGVTLRRIRSSGMAPLGDIDIRFNTLPGTLVAITGKNGNGKSTLISCFPVRCIGEMPCAVARALGPRRRDARG